MAIVQRLGAAYRYPNIERGCREIIFYHCRTIEQGIHATTHIDESVIVTATSVSLKNLDVCMKSPLDDQRTTSLPFQRQ